ncbi:MAG: PIG-L deacetylase family protein [Candidatus Hermodarchaeia archaeon]|jgi:LmbE family N-acetylglucosaminyl deacetylase
MSKVLPYTEEPVTILIVEAHPDDAAIFAGGTLARLAAEGHKVVNLCSTYGEKGTLDRSMTREKMIEIQKREALRAADVLGISEVIFLEIPDGELQPGLELRRQFTEIIRSVQPDVVFSFDPHIPYDPHPDHQATSRTIYEACLNCHLHLVFPEQLAEGLTSHYVQRFYGWETSNPNTFVDITESLETKLKALEQYESQMQMIQQESQARASLAGIEVPMLKETTWKEFVRYWITTEAQKTGIQAECLFAEAFNDIGFNAVRTIAEQLEPEE